MDIKKILFKTCELDAEVMLPDAVLVCNKDFVIIWKNDKAVNLLNIVTDKQTALSEIIENGGNMTSSALTLNKSVKVKLINKDLYLDMTVRESDDIYVLSFRECTELSVEQENEDYKVINRDKNNFLIKLTNDFKSPLQSIIGFSQAMADGLGGNISVQQEKYIKIIKKNSTDLMYFIEKLIMLSITETEHRQPNIKTFDILNCIKMLVKYNMQVNKEKSVKITLETDENMKNTFISDEDIIKQVLQNIIEVIMNSVEIGEVIVKLILPPEEICNQMNMPNNSLLLSLSSTSLLISESEIENIFDPYKIIDTSNRKNILRAIILLGVKNLVQVLGGQVWVETKPLKETSFYVLLPQKEV